MNNTLFMSKSTDEREVGSTLPLSFWNGTRECQVNISELRSPLSSVQVFCGRLRILRPNVLYSNPCFDPSSTYPVSIVGNFLMVFSQK
jgi:hypothetical protein